MSAPSASFKTLREQTCFGGVQGVYQHDSPCIGLPMKFGVFRPQQAERGPVPVLIFLAGLTCDEETFAVKAGAQQHAARHGLLLVTPDTSPRDTGIEGADASWDLGTAAGFYLDATEAPWCAHWRMASYVTKDLLEVIGPHFPTQEGRVGICGHSMGGHGALTLALKHPGLFRSVSALAPISSPSRCPWGRKAFKAYLGDSPEGWAAHDAVELILAGARVPNLFVDQGLADPFLAEQLLPERLEAACQASGQTLTLRRHQKYDHGYYFIATFIADHIAHHAQALHA